MSSIDAVIAQARRPGVFTEKKRFSVARTQAIQKLRKFALADPFAYVLELVQAAIANGARYIDVALDEDSLTLSYIGGGIPEAALSRLFDFLFAAKDRLDLGYVRELALGVNAMMLFKPERIVIESGDGTREGTTRVELLGGGDRFDVGRPDHALSGTFVRAEGMDRGAVAQQFGRKGGGLQLFERGILETRCLTAPVPIVFNGEPLFGYSSLRIPTLFGYRKQVDVDEGDLYGAIGTPVGDHNEFALLTRGVLIETAQMELLPGRFIGGVVCFDGLRKTADHARIVRDDRWDELWLRLRPYALRLVDGEQVKFAAAQVYGGEELGVDELRRLLRERRRAVVLPRESGELETRRAERIAAALDAVLLVTGPGEARSLRVLGGEGVRVFEPDLEDMQDLAFFTRRPADPPPRPWLIQPVQAPALAIAGLIDAIVGGGEDEESEQCRELLRGALGEVGEVRTTVYVPAAAEDALVVELRMLGRALGRATPASSFSGMVVVAELPDLQPAWVREVGVETIAGAIVRHAAETLAEAGRRVLGSMSEEACAAGGLAARQVLATVARAGTLRLRGSGEAAGIDVALLEAGPPGVDLLGLPVLATVDGRAIGLRELIGSASERCWGLVYGVVEGVEPDLAGLDAGRIVRLDAASERHLIALVGEAAYVRIDARQVCAEHRGVVCREFAAGLREFPAFPLLVEGVDPSGWTKDEREACLAALFEQLLAVVAGDSPRLASLPADEADELRRHALRHLQWLVLNEQGRWAELAEHVPGGRSLAGQTVAVGALLRALSQWRTLQAFCWHGPLPGDGPPVREAPAAVELGPPVFLLLARHGRVVSGFDFEVDVADVEQDMAQETGSSGHLARAPVALAGVEGWVAAPVETPAAPAVLLWGADGRRVHVFAEAAQELGVVGVLRSTRTSWTEDDTREVMAALSVSAADVFRRVVQQVYAGGEAAERGLRAALEHAGRHLRLSVDPSGRVRATATGGAAEFILEQPLFPGPRGVPRSGWRVVQAACEALGRGEAPDVAGLPPVLSDWCARWLRADRVVRPAAHGVRRPPARPAGPRTARALEETLEGWLHRLRPDARGLDWNDRATVSIVDGELAARMGAELAAIDGDARSWLVTLNGAHWLVRWARAGEPRALGWLLLAIYARGNEVFEAVTGVEELEFQGRVAAALLSGELHAAG